MQPRFHLHWGDLQVERGGNKRGTLVQAKRRLHEAKWNQLTDNQQSTLPDRMTYATLLRYEFHDAGNTLLAPFFWNNFAGHRIADVVKWLQTGAFPPACDTQALIEALSTGLIGTDDEKIIELVICPGDAKFVVVEIDWHDDTDPSAAIRALNRDLAMDRSLQAARSRSLKTRQE